MAAPCSGPTFQAVTQSKSVLISDEIKFAFTLAPNAEAWTINFEQFTLDIADNVDSHHQTAVRVRTFTYIQTIDEPEEVSVKQDFRGFVALDEDESAVIIIHAGTQTTVIDPKEVSTEEQPDDGRFESTYIASVQTLVPKGQSLKTTVILLADPGKCKAESSISLSLDSIDSELKFSQSQA